VDSSGPTDGKGLFVAEGSLEFGDLLTTGNHVRGDTNLNNDIFSRPITASLSGGSGIWFSILANKLQNNFSAAEGGLVIANQTVGNSRLLENNGTDGLAGFGVGPTTSGNDWTAYAWDGASQSVGDAALGVPTNGSEVHLLVGNISFDTGTAGTDEYTLYEYLLDAGSVEGGVLSQICSTLEVNVDQTALDTLNLTRQVNSAYDEIRIGMSLNDVLGLETAVLLADADGDGDVDAADYIMVKTHFGVAPAAGDGPGGDIADGASGPGQDGVVDWYDLQLLQANYSPAAEDGSMIPEPASLLIMLAAGLPALLKRRRLVTA